MGNRKQAAIVMFCSLGLMTVRVHCQQPGPGPWTFHRIKPPFSGRLIGINDSGEVLAAAGARGFVFRDGDTTISLLNNPSPAQGANLVIAINNKNQVLLGSNYFSDGYYLYELSDKTFHSISLNARIKRSGVGDAITALDALYLTGFNDADQFIGTSSIPNGEVAVYGTLVVGAPGSKRTDNQGLGSLVAFGCPDGAQTKPAAINNHGQIVGTCKATRADQPALTGFRYDIATSTMTLFSFPQAVITTPTAINDAGLIAGNYQPSREQRVSLGFVYDGSQFTTLRPAGGANLGPANYLPLGINSRGEIVGGTLGPVRDSFLATPGQQPAPHWVDVLSVYTPKKHPYRHSAKAAPPMRDPNLVGNLGEGGIVSWNYLAQYGTIPFVTFSATTSDRTSGEYLGFDDVHGSLIRGASDPYIYAYDGKTRNLSWIAAGLYDLPEDVIGGLQNPSNTIRDLRGEGELPAAQGLSPALHGPHGEKGAIAPGGDGKFSLSYTLFSPGDAADGSLLTFPVVRPTHKPASATEELSVPPGRSTGNWLWIGDGPQKGLAGMFSLDAGGIVTWNFIDPQLAAQYLGGASSASQVPASIDPLAGTGARVQGGLLTFTRGDRSKATFKVVRPKVMQNSQAAGVDVTGTWIAIQEGGNGIVFTVLADSSVTGKEVPATLAQMLIKGGG